MPIHMIDMTPADEDGVPIGGTVQKAGTPPLVHLVDADGVPISLGGGGGGGAPTDATYLVTSANGTLTNEVVVGATPGGELGGTWASPTVDDLHAGIAHSALAPLASPALTGNPTAPTQANGNNSTRLATTAFVNAEILSDAYTPGGTDIAVADGGTGSSNASGARTNLGLVIGTDVQAFDPQLAVIAADPVSHGSMGAAETFDATAAVYHYGTLDANLTVTLTAGASGQLWELVLELLQDATGSRTVTWPASVKWTAATAPTLTTTASRRDFITLWTRDGGTTWWGTSGPMNLV